jgi:hypothetical protein
VVAEQLRGVVMSPNIDEPNADEAAETQAGPANDGTDIVVSDATQLVELAWSHDEPEPQAHRHRWATAWAIAAIFLVCGTVMAVSIWALSPHRTTPLTAAAAPSRPPVAEPSAPPVVTTVTAPPVTVTAPPVAAPAPTTVPSSVTPSPAPTAHAEGINREVCLAVMALGVTPSDNYSRDMVQRYPGMTFDQTKALVERAYSSVRFHGNPMCDGVTIPDDY